MVKFKERRMKVLVVFIFRPKHVDLVLLINKTQKLFPRDTYAPTSIACHIYILIHKDKVSL